MPSDATRGALDGTTASFLDSCDGHPGPRGQYHYNGLPDRLVQYATTGEQRSARGAAARPGPLGSKGSDSRVAETAVRLAARKSQVIILTDELEDLDCGGLC